MDTVAQLVFPGLLSWLAAGAVGGLLSRLLPPRVPRPGPGPSLGWGAAGGLLGGLLATALGFGGAFAFHAPAAVVALLAGALALLLRRLRIATRRP